MQHRSTVKNDVRTHNLGCISDAASRTLHLQAMPVLFRLASTMRDERSDLQGDSPTTLEYQSNCLLAHVVFPARALGIQEDNKEAATTPRVNVVLRQVIAIVSTSLQASPAGHEIKEGKEKTRQEG